jgi:hypothetical protein
MAESREVRALRQYLKDSGHPHRVTDVSTPGVHARNSRHYQSGTDGDGLALDFGGPRPGDHKAMGVIFAALGLVADQLHELIGGPLFVTRTVKNGRWGNPVQQYGAKTWQAHNSHVHVSVDRGTFVHWPGAMSHPAVAKNGPVHDYEEAQVKSQLMFVQLDDKGNGYSDWQLNLGRDPIPVSAVQQGPSPPDDGYWLHQAKVNLAMQPRGGVLRVVARGGTPKDTVGVYVSCA